MVSSCSRTPSALLYLSRASCVCSTKMNKDICRWDLMLRSTYRYAIFYQLNEGHQTNPFPLRRRRNSVFLVSSDMQFQLERSLPALGRPKLELLKPLRGKSMYSTLTHLPLSSLKSLPPPVNLCSQAPEVSFNLLLIISILLASSAYE